MRLKKRLNVHQASRAVPRLLNRRAEQRGVFQKELSPLGKEDRELRHVVDLQVGIGLREVRVRREVENIVRVDGPLEIAPELRGRVRRSRRGSIRLGEDIRLNADVRLRRRRLEPGQAAGILHPRSAEYAGEGRERRDFVGQPAVAVDVKAPALHRIRRLPVPQSLPRDRDLGVPAGIRARGAHAPQTIPVHIEVEIVERQVVALHAIGVGGEAHGVALIVEAVEGERDEVVRQIIEVALEVGRANRLLPGRVLRIDPDVQELLVVQNPDLGFETGRRALVRLDLCEVRRSLSQFPFRLVQHAVDVQLRLDPDRPDRFLHRIRGEDVGIL